MTRTVMALIILQIGCGARDGGAPVEPEATAVTRPAAAEARTPIAHVPDAENIFTSSDGRVFVAGSDGLYLLDTGAPGGASRVPVALEPDALPSTAARCFFFAMSQMTHYLYTACSPDPTDPGSPRYVLVLDLSAPLELRAIYRTHSPAFVNGLTTDDANHIYLAPTDPSIAGIAGKIIRLTLSSPTEVSAVEDWLPVWGKLNGIKASRDALYIATELSLGLSSTISRVPLEGAIRAPQILFVTLPFQYVDDLVLVAGGVVLTTASDTDDHSPLNGIVHIDETGLVLHRSSAPFERPSDVTFAPPVDRGSLLVSERSGVVSRFDVDWGLRPRK